MLDNLLNAVTLIAWVLLFFVLILYALRGYQRGGVVEGARALTRGRIILMLLITLGITLLSASLVFSEPQEVGVVISVISRDGYREQPMRSGLHWIVPLAEKVI